MSPQRNLPSTLWQWRFKDVSTILYLVFWVAYPYQIDYLDSGIESKNYRAKTFSTNGKWNDRFHFHQLRIASTDLWGAPLILSELTVQFFRTVENAENSPVKTDHFD